MPVKFSEFSFNNQSNRDGRLVLEAPIGEIALDFRLNPGASGRLNPSAEDADSVRLVWHIKEAEDIVSELSFQPAMNAANEGNPLRTFATAMRLDVNDDKGTLSIDTAFDLA